ncbi:hypothetical protein cypCar_00013893 [Cyprinus carpio]|nr:hypothetical protein cypCar_00013893 [Cyprinus carpio]
MVLHGCGYIQFETGNTQVQTALISPSFDFSNFHQSGDGVRGLSSLKCFIEHYHGESSYTLRLCAIVSECNPDSEYAESSKQKTDNPQWSYQNITDENGILEPTYVDPIPNSLYANEDDTDSCNYENWDNRDEDDEPDYVNEII